MQGLRDIKGIVEVTDYSLYWFVLIIVLLFMFMMFGVYKYKTRRRRKKRLSPREQALINLYNLDFNDTKNVAYGFEEHTQVFINDKNQEQFNTIKSKLKRYKYKKDIPALDNEIKYDIQKFIKGLK